MHDENDTRQAALAKKAWDAGDFEGAAEAMRPLRTKFGEAVRQEGDGTSALYVEGENGVALRVISLNGKPDRSFRRVEGKASLVEIKD